MLFFVTQTFFDNIPIEPSTTDQIRLYLEEYSPAVLGNRRHRLRRVRGFEGVRHKSCIIYYIGGRGRVG